MAKPREHINQAVGCCQHPEPPATPSRMIAALISSTSKGAKGSMGCFKSRPPFLAQLFFCP